ncbi:hypothetical protein [Cognatishimia activa]|uniref:hypothetical protein n=1 Tax=Cognatishimia activa TaxID=1715691 RepID=UPI00223113EA|nr:hypothetical protein [Cognatishimia activa]UZD92045.1 hypothetical protein M0D42_05385 [Cognatishimia activa]
MTFTLPFFGILDWKSILRPSNKGNQSPVQENASEDESSEAERAFLREIMRENPEALQSEIGVMALMSQYPRNF